MRAKPKNHAARDDVKMDDVRSAVTRAIRTATAPGGLVERKLHADSTLSWSEPSPSAGLQAALTVIAVAQGEAYKFVLGLRAEGTSWHEVADLLDIPWSSDYSRPERAYELVLGPEPEGRRSFHERNLHWRCGGPLGCDKFITDHGPYNGHPHDNESGHDAGCRRHATEAAAYEREQEERDERGRIAEEAMETLQADNDTFGVETARRARRVLAHGGQYLGWSTSETLAVALALRDDEMLTDQGYSTRDAALDRVWQGSRSRPREVAGRWLATVRAAATGRND